MIKDYTQKNKIISILEVLAKKVCAYGNPKRCDCKFAADGEREKVGTGTERGNGCCELAVAITAIKKLTDEQWDYLLDDLPEESEIEFGTTKIKLYPLQILDLLNEQQRMKDEIARLTKRNKSLLKKNKELKA